MIPDEEVERVRESAEIVSVIGEYVNLRRTGTDYRGPCPFHQGTHRNFSVSPKKKIYYCFVCHAGGDVFQFLQQKLGVDWPEAVRLVARRSGIELREVQSRLREGPDPRQPLWEANAAALEYFGRVLRADALGEDARAYLKSREVGDEVRDRFSLGFAPRDVGLMRAHLNSLGIDDARQLEAGLLVRREEGGEPRPRFRQRLVFPIHDIAGRVVGFGGRLLAPGEPKYLNSGESSIYSKGKLLYNLYQAKNSVRREDRLIVVEGYFDVVRLVAAGLETVVAPLGTALTTDQAQLIVRYTKNVYLLYDSDKAGLKATFRAGDELLAQGATVRTVSLPPGEDPDTFVRTHGREGLERELAKAMDVFERKLQFLRRGGWFDELHKRRAAIDRLLPTIRATSDAVLRDMYIAQASESSKVDRRVLESEVAANGGATRGVVRQAAPASEPGPRQPPQPEAPRPSSRDAVPRPQGPGLSAERDLLAAMLRSPAALERVLERLAPHDFHASLHREIFSAIQSVGHADDLEGLSDGLSPGAVELLDEITSAAEASKDLDQTVEHSLVRLEERRLQSRNREIDSLMKLADDAEVRLLIAEKMENTLQLRELHPVRHKQ